MASALVAKHFPKIIRTSLLNFARKSYKRLVREAVDGRDPRWDVVRRISTVAAEAWMSAQRDLEETSDFSARYLKEVTNRRWYALMDERHRRAAQSTYDFIDENMRSAMYLPTKTAAWRKVAASIPADGHILQFGVYKGGSINALADLWPSRRIDGFDSFQGLPENWSYSAAGSFDLRGSMPKVRDNVTLHAGWFEDTLPIWGSENPGNVAFLDLDCDLYSSTRVVLSHLRPRIQSGTWIHIDEMIGYYGWQDHEFKAFQEFLSEAGHRFEYLYYGSTYVLGRIR
ncbi:MAG: class I SAM-dependent methyltransferase [Deltaproteobacteria bacterium]|nr:class I SAM-dependent methyltransferase [Deltaproteobacteria bacterium]